MTSISRGCGNGSEYLRMVDPQPGDLAVGDHSKHAAVRRGEHARVFHPESAQLVDVEKAAVVDLVRGDAPERQPVMLPLAPDAERRAA